MSADGQPHKARMLLTAWLALSPAFASGALLYANSTGEQRRSDGSTWKVTVIETKRADRYSVLRISHEGRLPSVGSSFFIACSVLNLARQRGVHFVAQLETSATLKVGFLDSLEDDPAKVVGADFANLPRERKYDAEQFAPICDLSKARAAPHGTGP